MAGYEGTSTPFESMALRDIRDPVVMGERAGSMVAAAEALQAVGDRLEQLNVEFASIERAYSEAHEGEAAEQTRSYLRKLGEPGRIGAITFPAAVQALRDQAAHYEHARAGLESVEPSAPSTSRVAAAASLQNRDTAALIARQYENSSNQTLAASFESFAPVSLAPPNADRVDPGPAGSFPSTGGIGSGVAFGGSTAAVAPAQAGSAALPPIEGGAVRAPDGAGVGSSGIGTGVAALPGSAAAAGGGAVGALPGSGLGTAGTGSALTGAAGSAATGGSGATARGPSAVPGAVLGSTGPGRGGSLPGATGGRVGSGEALGRGASGLGGRVPTDLGGGGSGGRGSGGVGEGSRSVGTDGVGRSARGVLEPAPRAVVGERGGVLGAEEVRQNPRSTASSHMPLMPGAGASMRPGENRGRPAWLVEEDPEGVWAADVPDHCPPVLGRPEV